jgi:hypothetical protein
MFDAMFIVSRALIARVHGFGVHFETKPTLAPAWLPIRLGGGERRGYCSDLVEIDPTYKDVI